jgi:hypothetical protein
MDRSQREATPCCKTQDEKQSQRYYKAKGFSFKNMILPIKMFWVRILYTAIDNTML